MKIPKSKSVAFGVCMGQDSFKMSLYPSLWWQYTEWSKHSAWFPQAFFQHVVSRSIESKYQKAPSIWKATNHLVIRETDEKIKGIILCSTQLLMSSWNRLLLWDVEDIHSKVNTTTEFYLNLQRRKHKTKQNAYDFSQEKCKKSLWPNLHDWQACKGRD